MDSTLIEKTFQLAKERYEAMGSNVEKAVEALNAVSVSIHCWQGDDVGGFEGGGGDVGGGLAVTGNYPGKARTPDELRQDFETALSCIPGSHRFNLHASYAETGGKKIDRNALDSSMFQGWIDWAKSLNIGVDFNPTFFAHPKAGDGFTLAHADESIRGFWVEHGQICRTISADIGKALGSPCINNVWIPDGYKDMPIDRKAPRERLKQSLDEIFAASMDKNQVLDSVECKLFGIGSECYVVGSHEFYLGYAIKNKTLLTLDTGHFHPTESVSDKISSVMMWVDELLLHVSRGVRWDSDHVVTLSDELQTLMQEVARGGYLDRIHIGLDYFDASINRVAAWVIGTRCLLKSLLMAFLEPTDTLRELEQNHDYTSRLALLEEIKTLPFGAVWDYCCLQAGVPVGEAWLDEIKRYENDVLLSRG